MPYVERLSSAHDLSEFDCGVPALDDWLKRHALVSQAASAVQTYVGIDGNIIVGFYALAAGSVSPAHAPARITAGLGRYPVPVAVLARLAVDRRHQRRGIGQALLKDALRRVAAAADILGVRAVLVDAKDDAARRFYERFEFEPSPTDPRQLFLLMKDLRREIARATPG